MVDVYVLWVQESASTSTFKRVCDTKSELSDSSDPEIEEEIEALKPAQVCCYENQHEPLLFWHACSCYQLVPCGHCWT